jgi:kynurenine 3-monooxygenase
MPARIVIVGAGLCGNLLAILLARRGFAVTVYDRGEPPGASPETDGRSINLALAARGIRALERADVFADIEPLLLPMGGRIVHETDGEQRFLPYGQRPGERIWSVSRSGFNRRLVDIAATRHSVDYRFGHACTAFDAERMTAIFDAADGTVTDSAALTIAADGAGSTIRRKLVAAGRLDAREELLDHGYRELVVPPGADGDFALRPDGLHIWPRGGFMLIALPNLDRSFTATLFLPHRGDPGFDTVTAEQVEAFFGRHFADALPLLPELAASFAARPIGTLGSVHCSPWSHAADPVAGPHVLLIGDAAHAIVPFHGQGMNAAFEDCAVLDALIAEHGPNFGVVVPRFEAARRENAEAIAAMALENYREMRDRVRDPDFERRSVLAFELERRFPGRFIPRYSMVMFHPEISYAEARRRGSVQAEILDAAGAAPNPSEALESASALVEARL